MDINWKEFEWAVAIILCRAEEEETEYKSAWGGVIKTNRRVGVKKRRKQIEQRNEWEKRAAIQAVSEERGEG